MPKRVLLACALAVSLGACAHKPLSGAALDEVRSPAFISRIEAGAGPRSDVFAADSTWSPKLKKLDPKEADRRLANKLRAGMNRFEIAERLRASTVAQLPEERPWTHQVAPVQVSSVLQQYLVDEVPAAAPDYNLMREVGADSVVEFVIEEYGMRSSGGRAQAYMLGYGRMFKVGEGELWRRNFKIDLVDEPSVEKLDPFRVAKEPAYWRTAMETMLDAVAAQFAKDLTPSDRRGGKSPPPGSEELEQGGDQEAPQKAPEQKPEDTELPDPDPI